MNEERLNRITTKIQEQLVVGDMIYSPQNYAKILIIIIDDLQEQFDEKIDEKVHTHKEKTKVVLEQMGLVFEVQEKAINDLQEQNKLLHERLLKLETGEKTNILDKTYFDNFSRTDGLGQKGERF